ncbi:hypothetical protein NEMIN01_2397, partial [Nematocida minor]|uniref:uncharacterized protein n=1 Tax=Nematocida minor TaxID=1912983 RepID=UPI002220C875
MIKREVNLKVNVEGIVQGYQSISKKYTIPSVDDSTTNIIRCFAMLKEILDKNLEIEGRCSEEEREDILNIAKTRICDYFMHDSFGKEVTNNLYSALSSGNDSLIKDKAIDLINCIVEKNPVIYNSEHGICRKDGAADVVSGDLSPRTCKLQIDDEKFSSLKGLLQFTSESLDRKNFCYLSNIMSLADIFEMYSSERACYTLDDLYSIKYKNTDTPLVDYGLSLILEKYYLIEDLAEKNKKLKADGSDSQDVVDEINSLFSSGDIEIIVSIRDSMEKIKCEKEMHSHMIQTLECAANNSSLLKETDEPN